MKKIELFIERLKDSNIAVSDLLTEAKILATDLEQTEFLQWINKEINGYDKEEQYPDYRWMKGQMKAFNPYRGWVPVQHPTLEAEERFTTRSTGQSVREIEELLRSSNVEFEMPYPDAVSKEIIEDSFKPKLSLFIGRTSMVAILSSVRDRLLNWVLELKNSGVEGDDIEFSTEEKKEAREVEAKFSISNIENFHGNLGDAGKYKGNIYSPAESFWSKAFWYIVVALGVVIIGDITSALLLRHFWGIS